MYGRASANPLSDLYLINRLNLMIGCYLQVAMNIAVYSAIVEGGNHN